MEAQNPKLLNVIAHHRQQVRISMLAVLCWIMTSDGEIDPEERAFFSSLSTDEIGENVRRKVIECCTEDASIQLACEILRDALAESDRSRFVELCVGMMVADGYVTISERYVLRFLADLFEIRPQGFRELYKDTTGQDLSSLGDPSSIKWWKKRRSERGSDKRRRSQKNRSRKNGKRNRSSANHLTGERAKALAVLGLQEGANMSEIRQAYRRLAKVHHPDRFEQLGPEAVEAANATFKRIQAAYENLKRQR